MGVRKIYQAIEFKSLDTYEMVNGTRVLIQFRSGSLAPTAKGLYVTTDPSIAAVMDKTIASGVASYKCILTETFQDAEEEKRAARSAIIAKEVKDAALRSKAAEDAEAKAKTDAEEEAKAKAEAEAAEAAEAAAAAGNGGGAPQTVQVPGILTVQDARAYLVEKFGIPASKLPNGPAVKKAAAENKVIFSDLP